MPCFPCPVHHLLVTVIHLLPLHLVPSSFSDHGVVVFFHETCHASEDLRRERLFRRLSRARQWPVGGLAPFGEYWPPPMGVCRDLHGGIHVGPMPPQTPRIVRGGSHQPAAQKTADTRHTLAARDAGQPSSPHPRLYQQMVPTAPPAPYLSPLAPFLLFRQPLKRLSSLLLSFVVLKSQYGAVFAARELAGRPRRRRDRSRAFPLRRGGRQITVHLLGGAPDLLQQPLPEHWNLGAAAGGGIGAAAAPRSSRVLAARVITGSAKPELEHPPGRHSLLAGVERH